MLIGLTIIAIFAFLCAIFSPDDPGDLGRGGWKKVNWNIIILNEGGGLDGRGRKWFLRWNFRTKSV